MLMSCECWNVGMMHDECVVLPSKTCLIVLFTKQHISYSGSVKIKVLYSPG